MTRLTRRQFLKLTGTAAGVALLGSACAAQPSAPPAAPAQPAAPSSTPVPAPSSPTPEPSATPPPPSEPTATPPPTPEPTATAELAPSPTSAPAAGTGRSDIMKVYPAAPSRVVSVRHAGVWKSGPGGGAKDNEALEPQAIRAMLDAGIVKLTGLDDPQAAWGALFSPQERIAIKVNTIQGSGLWTHVPMALAVADCLQSAGVPAEQIVIFDRYAPELERAGYTINVDGPGVRCRGTDLKYSAGWKVMDTDIELSNILLECDALINLPVLKQHSMTGITFGLKNHYGTLDNPSMFHGERAQQALGELNALPPIKERTRLTIGDALAVAAGSWYSVVAGDTLFLSFDPVAHDAAGLQLYKDVMVAKGKNPTSATRLATLWLENAAALGLGTHDPAHIETVEVNLG